VNAKRYTPVEISIKNIGIFWISSNLDTSAVIVSPLLLVSTIISTLSPFLTVSGCKVIDVITRPGVFVWVDVFIGVYVGGGVYVKEGMYVFWNNTSGLDLGKDIHDSVTNNITTNTSL
jgi:hypothetical protein